MRDQVQYCAEDETSILKISILGRRALHDCLPLGAYMAHCTTNS